MEFSFRWDICSRTLKTRSRVHSLGRRFLLVHVQFLRRGGLQDAAGALDLVGTPMRNDQVLAAL